MDNLRRRKILRYDDLVNIPPGNSTEELVDVCAYDGGIISSHNKSDMLDYTGDVIVVRDSLAQKLTEANRILGKKHDGYGLKVAYGYRHPKVQELYFDRRRSELKSQHPLLTENAIKRTTHNFVAVPEVAGHPAGAAVDLTVVDRDGKELDMGTAIADYSDPEKIKTFATSITQEQRENRQLLHDLMVEQGFAPFYGEWWHFSYGDREWAAFYSKGMALYDAVEITL